MTGSESGLPANDEHEVKIWPEHFEPVVTYAKRYEVRKDDRPYKVHDSIRLNEYDADTGYTGRYVVARITHILRGAEYGIFPGYCVLGLADYHEDHHDQ